MKKIKVCSGVSELKKFIEEHKDKKICLYLAEKTKEAWDISTSRVYMNQIDEKFIYLPINIPKGDWDSIREIYSLADNNNQIVAINQTQPHKSNPIQKEWFSSQNIPKNVDSLVKDKNNKLKCYDLNGPSFLNWFEDDVTSLLDSIVIIFGVGGVGEPIARIISKKKIKCLYLVDINTKEKLAKELSENVNVLYFDSLNKIKTNSDDKIILINCAGKEGGDDKTILDVLNKLKNMNHIFVDLRPQLNIKIVNIAKKQGWNAYTGYGMNSRNDYVLLQKIQESTGINIPSFEQLAKLVKEAS